MKIYLAANLRVELNRRQPPGGGGHPSGNHNLLLMITKAQVSSSHGYISTLVEPRAYAKHPTNR